MLEGYKTIQEIAKEWELTPRQIQNLCSTGKIPEVGKIGNAWVLFICQRTVYNNLKKD